MTVNLMRYIDHWLGIPLCFLLSCLNPLLKIFGSKKTEKKVPPEKIFFIKLSELGAIVLAHPLLKRARKEYPGAELFFVTFEKNRGHFRPSREHGQRRQYLHHPGRFSEDIYSRHL